MTHNYWYRCWTPSPRSVADAAALDAGQASCTVTGPTTSRLYAARYAAAASPCGSPAKASSPPSGWAATAGSSRPACPGCCETAASCAATTAKPNISKPSPTSAAPCSAGVASPRPPTEIRPKWAKVQRELPGVRGGGECQREQDDVSFVALHVLQVLHEDRLG